MAKTTLYVNKHRNVWPINLQKSYFFLNQPLIFYNQATITKTNIRKESLLSAEVIT